MEESTKLIPDILEMSMYETIEMSEFTYEQLYELLIYANGQVNQNSISSLDSYCNLCNKETTFNSRNTPGEIIDSVYHKILNLTDNRFGSNQFDAKSFQKHLEEIEIFTRSFYCPRAPKDFSHDIVIILRANNGQITKIGQFPQIADLENSQLKKYKGLDKEIYYELNRAAGLNSHGIGVGSFVYLRRIIEKYIVLPEIEKLIQDRVITIQQSEYTDFKGKVALAKDHLPSILVDNSRIYSILSKGIHALSEKECLEIFSPLLIAIELILDERLEIVERDKKISKMKNDLNKIY